MATQPSTEPYSSNLAHAFMWPFKLAFKYFLIYVFVAMLGIIIASGFNSWFWSTDPTIIMSKLVDEDFRRLSIATQSENLINLSVDSANFAYWLFFKLSGVHEAMTVDIEQFKRDWRNSPDAVLLQFVQDHREEVRMAMYSVQLFGLRLGILLSSSAIFILAWFCAGVDGLAERYIRRACAGRESSDIFKLARVSRLFGMSFLITIYLSFPVSFNPTFVVLPIACMLAICTRAEFKYYKKYL